MDFFWRELGLDVLLEHRVGSDGGARRVRGHVVEDGEELLAVGAIGVAPVGGGAGLVPGLVDQTVVVGGVVVGFDVVRSAVSGLLQVAGKALHSGR